MNYLMKKMIRHRSKVTKIFEELCKKHNLSFVIEGSDKGYFIDQNNIKHYFDYGTIDLNREESIDSSNDKEMSSKIVKSLGVDLPKEVFIKKIENLEEVLFKSFDFVQKIEFPIMVKPINGRQGNDIFKVSNKKDLIRVINYFFENKIKFIIQEYLDLLEIRVVILDGELLQVYKRFRPKIVGDGTKTIGDLIDERNKEFKIHNRNTIINKNDEQIRTIINEFGYNLNSVPSQNEIIYLSYGRNLSKGGEYEFIENELNQIFLEILDEISKGTGLRLIGFDLFIKKDIKDISDLEDFVLIEYNGSPDLENNFYFDNEYKKFFEQIYVKIFNKICRL
jgi:glutathione synthase/RimK-type ligase-like ATP-grasp enzyme